MIGLVLFKTKLQPFCNKNVVKFLNERVSGGTLVGKRRKTQLKGGGIRGRFGNPNGEMPLGYGR
jgi:hypothetical protein